MIFGNNKFRDLNSVIEHSSILRQFETKFLGVILAADLKWRKHTEIVSIQIQYPKVLEFCLKSGI